MKVKIKSVTYGIGMDGSYGKVKVELHRTYEELEQEDIEQFEQCKASGDSLDDTLLASSLGDDYEAWVADADYEIVFEEELA